MAVIDNIKNLLTEFVENGGNVNELKPGDKLYDYIKDAKINGVDGKKLTIDEKFIKAGHPRDPLYYLRTKLISGVNAYLDNGGSFHVERKTLPFYNDLKSYVRAYKKEKEKDISYDDAMKELGFSNYSTIYYKYSHIMDLKEFQDDEGYVDSYRKDDVMKSYIHQASRQLEVPIAIIVSLIADQNLKKYSIDVDFMEETRKELIKELEKAKSKAVFLQSGEDVSKITLENLSKLNLTLYNRLIYVKNRMAGIVGSNVSYEDVLYMLDIDEGVVGFKEVEEKSFDVETVMRGLSKTARKKQGKLYRKDIPNDVYRKLVKQSLRLGCYTKEFFRMYDIDYVDGVNNSRFKRFTVKDYPYLKRMRADRDSIMSEYFKNNSKVCEEEAFEYYFNACLDIYERYKDKIYAFDINENLDSDNLDMVEE